MPNIRIKGLQDNMWVDYDYIDGEVNINCIYLDSDKTRTDLYDYISDSVISKALMSAEQDWQESYWERMDALRDQMLEMRISD